MIGRSQHTPIQLVLLLGAIVSLGIEPSSDDADPRNARSNSTPAIRVFQGGGRSLRGTDAQDLGANARSEGKVQMVEPFTQTVVVHGTGLTDDSAVNAALRNAVHQVVGVYVDTEYLVKGDRLIYESILSHAAGFVETYRVVNTRTDSEGLVTVTIEARIKKMSIQQKIEKIKSEAQPLGGASLTRSLLSQIANEKEAGRLFAKTLNDLNFPQSLISVEIDTKNRRVLSKNDNFVQLSWVVKLKYDQQRYQKDVHPRLRQLLRQVALFRVEDQLLNQQIPSGEAGIVRQLSISGLSAWPIDFGDYKAELAPQLRNYPNAQVVLLMDRFDDSNGAVGFSLYGVPAEVNSVLSNRFENPIELRLFLKDQAELVVFEERFNFANCLHRRSPGRRVTVFEYYNVVYGANGLAGAVQYRHGRESVNDIRIQPCWTFVNLDASPYIMPMSTHALSFEWKPTIPFGILQQTEEIEGSIVYLPHNDR